MNKGVLKLEKFTAKFDKNSYYVGVVIGDRRLSDNNKNIIVTQIVRVTIENEYVYVQGYGILLDE